MTSQVMFEMHIFVVVGKNLSMHKIVQNHPKLNSSLLFLYRYRCVQRTTISWSWTKFAFFMTI
jgi:hypothetical protein